MKLRCKLGLHVYAPWGDAYIAHSGARQSAKCVHCNKIKIRKVGVLGVSGSYQIETGSAEQINKKTKGE